MEANKLMSYFVRVTLEQTNYSSALSSTVTTTSNEIPGSKYTLRWSSLLLAAFMILGAAGNALVCIAIFTDRRLQNVTNYFLFSLAIADLLVSLIVMPFSILTELHDGYWHYGFILCAGYSYADVFLCSASIVHMSIISLDRYLGISRPLKTRNKSKLVVTFKIICVWVITTMISCPIAILAIVHPRDIYHEYVCAIDNPYFLIYGSTLAFLIPCLIMVATYVRTTQLLRQQAILCSSSATTGSGRGADGAPIIGLRRTRTRRSSSKKSNGGGGYNYRKRHSNVSSDSRSVNSRRNSPSLSNDCLRPPSLKRHPINRAANNFSVEMNDEISPQIEQPKNDRLQVLLPAAVPVCSKNRRPSRCSDGSLDVGSMIEDTQPGTALNPEKKLRNKLRQRTITFFRATRRSASASELANEQKATRVLGLVFGCFVICWTPFFVQNFTVAFCGQNCQMPHWLTSMFLWLGYLSSTINPIIYTTFNKRFRQAFTNILRCRCWRQRRHSEKRLSRASASSFHSANNNYHGYLTSAAACTGNPVSQTCASAYSKFNILCRTPPDLIAATSTCDDDLSLAATPPILR